MKRNTMLLAIRILYVLFMKKSEQESMKEFVDDEEKATIKVAKTLNKLVNKTNDLILNLTPENVTQHSRIE